MGQLSVTHEDEHVFIRGPHSVINILNERALISDWKVYIFFFSLSGFKKTTSQIREKHKGFQILMFGQLLFREIYQSQPTLWTDNVELNTPIEPMCRSLFNFWLATRVALLVTDFLGLWKIIQYRKGFSDWRIYKHYSFIISISLYKFNKRHWCRDFF